MSNKKQTSKDSKPGKTSKSKTLSMLEFAETLKQAGGKEFWSMYPFRERKGKGEIKAIYFNDTLPEYGTIRPITQKQIDDIERIMQCPLEIEPLRAFLSQNCNVTQFDNLTWDDILHQFRRFSLNSKKETLKANDTCNHTPDFCSVTWLGQPYIFNSTQTKIIKLLWESETPLQQKTIAAAINTISDNYRLIDSFRRNGKYHPAWNKMIKHLGQGVYTLAKPE
jgi:hypothetical protein